MKTNPMNGIGGRGRSLYVLFTDDPSLQPCTTLHAILREPKEHELSQGLSWAPSAKRFPCCMDIGVTELSWWVLLIGAGQSNCCFPSKQILS
jgi:hypothetical protein